MVAALMAVGPAAAWAQGAADTITIPRVDRPPRIEDFMPPPRQARGLGTGLDGFVANLSGPLTPATMPAPLAGQVTGFRQREPGDGDPVSQPTEAHLSYDNANLYVVFVCRDDPAQIRANVTRREDIGDDDQVVLYLDTFKDGTRAYLFAANPRGVQLDGIRTEGQDEDMSFDAVWTSEGRLTDEGYVVRMSIPFRSLRFRSDSVQTWGIAVGRVIRRENEESYWPHLTKQLKGFVPQLATLQGLSGISPGRNIQVNPYYVRAQARVFDEDVMSHVTHSEMNVGVDAKLVMRDAFTLDATIDPDFSQVESDDPQVTVNQRFEVFFPEKRPFFLENAGYFQTPENLFFSRRIVEPGAGLRLTGKHGRWALGAVTMNDRATDQLAPDDPLYGRPAWIGALRVQRVLGDESTVGFLVTDREFSRTLKYDRMVSADGRIVVGDHWELMGQVMRSEQREPEGPRHDGWGAFALASYGSRNLDYAGRYREFSPDFDAPLGFVNRVGFREIKHEMNYDFRPDGLVTKFGPTVEVRYIWDHATGVLQDREFEGKFLLQLRGDTELEISRKQVMERFEGRGFRPHESQAKLKTAWVKWLLLDASYIWGTAVNHDPAEGLTPSLMGATETEAGVTVLVTPQLSLGTSYIESALQTRLTSARVLTERQLRARLEYQFSRELSLRAIADFAALDADTTLVDATRERQWGMDLLVTYLVHPGTAVHVGYIDQFENLAVLRASEEVIRSRSANMSIGRQVFVKLSYLWRP